MCDLCLSLLDVTISASATHVDTLPFVYVDILQFMCVDITLIAGSS